MTKRLPKMPRITEPDEGLVNFCPDALSGNVTLCGKTDFLTDTTHGENTEEECTCHACFSVLHWCQSHAKQ